MRQMHNSLRQSNMVKHFLNTAKNQSTIVKSKVPHEEPEEPTAELPTEPIIESQPEPIVEEPVVEKPVVEEPKIEEPKSMPSRLPNFNKK